MAKDAGAGRGNGGAGGLPAWAGPLRTAARLSKFEDKVLAFFAARGMEVVLSDGVVRPSGGTAEKMGSQRWGLSNLLRVCAQTAEAEWSGTVERHFEAMLNAQHMTNLAEIEAVEFGVVESQLVVRLWDEGAFGDQPAVENMVVRRDIPGLMTVLSMDMPKAVRTISAKEIARWGHDEDDLFDRARANVNRLATVKTEAHELGDGGVVVSVLGDSHFVASLALDLAARPELISKHGVFIGLPTRHVMLAAPFGGMDAFKSLQHLIMITRKWNEDGPGSLSSRVWWFRDGVWREILCEVEGDRLNVTPPPELVELMNDLGGGGGGGAGDGGEPGMDDE